jgi:hypothetical protein
MQPLYAVIALALSLLRLSCYERHIQQLSSNARRLPYHTTQPSIRDQRKVYLIMGMMPESPLSVSTVQSNRM